MAHFERIRDVISGPFSSDIVGQRTAAGWQLVSIEWRRELPDSEAPSEGAFCEDIPYGLRISDDCQRLEIEPTENQALMLMMDLLGQDFSYSHIVSDLNEKGFRTRDPRYRCAACVNAPTGQTAVRWPVKTRLCGAREAETQHHKPKGADRLRASSG